MSGLFAGYASVALLLTAGALLLRAAFAGAGRLGVPLSARQALRAARATLALALLLPLAYVAAREVVPAGPLFTFERSVVRHTGRLSAPAWPAPARASKLGRARAPEPAPVGAIALLLAAAVAAAVGGRHLSRHARLWRRLEALPRLRQVGRVAVVLSDEDATAFSAWFPSPGRGPSAYVVVPSALAVEPEDFKLTVLHELQHHRQRDTVLAYARLALSSAFFWNPVVRLLGRWLAEWQELACDEALVARGKVRPLPYAQCLLRAALRASHAPPLPAGATFMAHPTARRIEMLSCPRPTGKGRAAGVIAALALALTPLALWAQSASAGRGVTLAQAEALAAASNPPGDLAVVVDAQVLEQLNRLVATPKGRAFMRKALDNLAVHRAALVRSLRAKGLPEGLVAVAVVESAVSNLPETSTEPSLAPGMRGAGVWMFIPETARRFGLTVTAERDERLDVARETEAAAAYLSALYERYRDWRLALAAYNQGEQRVDRALAETGLRDVSELARRGHLNDYAGTVQAGLLILRNPRLLD